MISVQRVPDSWMALGLASHFIARRKPFGNYRADDLIRTLDGQIRRGHYVFALDTSQKVARVIGYLGWALYDLATAEQFAASGKPPATELADGGDVIWMLTVAADDRRALMAMTKATRALYPSHRLMGMRHKPGGRKVFFDQMPEGARHRPPNGQ